MMANLASQGFDPILGLSLAASFAQTGVVLGILLQTKIKRHAVLLYQPLSPVFSVLRSLPFMG